MTNDPATALAVWAQRASKNDQFVYFMGSLGAVRDGFSPNELGHMQTVSRAEVYSARDVGETAWTGYINGILTLTQRRIGPFQFEYIAERTGRSYTNILTRPRGKAPDKKRIRLQEEFAEAA